MNLLIKGRLQAFDKPGKNLYNRGMANALSNKFPTGSPEAVLAAQLDPKKIPQHVAIIMDGNGRWAKQHHLDRNAGHKQGTIAAREICECAARLGFRHLTLFTFSSENWKRPISEINALMEMLDANLTAQRDVLLQNKIRFKVIGDVSRLPKKLQLKIADTEAFTSKYSKMQINMALNYGGRMEIVHAVKRLLAEKASSRSISEKTIQKYLFTAGIPDPDLLIRTSGEYRISNFLLFQIAYSELYFTPLLWPDFTSCELIKTILDYQKRERRFGGL